MKHPVIRFVVLAAIGIIIGGAYAYFQVKDEAPQATAQVSASNSFGGEFALVSEDGTNVSQETWAGDHKLVFFGFTHCPDVCPTTLTKIQRAMDQLGDTADDITPLFITVDPERDNVEVVKEYTDMFDPRIIGLTGTQEQIDAAINAYKVYAAKDMSDGMGHSNGHDQMDEHHYMMQHSAYIYLMGPENDLVEIINSDDSAQDIAQAIDNAI